MFYQQRVALVRIYAFLSVLTTLIVLGGGIMRTVIHFTLKVCYFVGLSSTPLIFICCRMISSMNVRGSQKETRLFMYGHRFPPNII